MKKACKTCKESKTESKNFRQLTRNPVSYTDECFSCLHVNEKKDAAAILAERRLERRKEQRADNEVRRLSRLEIQKERLSAETYDKSKNGAERELIRRTLARRHLIRFIQRFERNYEAGWFHHDVCRRLENFLLRVMAGEAPCLMLFAPPRHGKSEIVSKKFPPWALGHYPELNFIAASYAVSLPLLFSRHIRGLLRDPRYQAIFPRTRLDPEFQGVENWMTTEGGVYIPTGVGGGIAGKGADILLLDDPIKDAEEADSEGAREKTWTWYGSEAHTRLSPKSGQLLMMTRRHDDDMAGRAVLMMNEAKTEIKEIEESMLEELAAKDIGEMEKIADLEVVKKRVADLNEEIDNWEIVCYPAIATDDEWLNLDDSVTPEPKTEESVFLRSKGGPLHPERYPYARLMRKKRVLQPRHWSALFQQNPIPEEGLFIKKEMIRYSPDKIDWRALPLILTGDLAITEKQTGNYTALGIGCIDYEDRLHVLEVIRGHWGTYEIVAALINLYVKYSTGLHKPIVGLETGQLEKAIMPVLRKEMRKRRVYMNMDDTLKPVTDKLVRARPLQGRMQQGMVIFPSNEPWVDMVIQELLRFPGGLNDDMVDMLAWMARVAARMHPPKRGKTRNRRGEKTVQEKLKDYMRNQGRSDSNNPMAA